MKYHEAEHIADRLIEDIRRFIILDHGTAMFAPEANRAVTEAIMGVADAVRKAAEARPQPAKDTTTARR